MTNWYYLPDKAILDLILIIARSGVVVQITAGKMVLMSVYTFGDVSHFDPFIYICVSDYMKYSRFRW